MRRHGWAVTFLHVLLRRRGAARGCRLFSLTDSLLMTGQSVNVGGARRCWRQRWLRRAAARALRGLCGAALCWRLRGVKTFAFHCLESALRSFSGRLRACIYCGADGELGVVSAARCVGRLEGRLARCLSWWRRARGVLAGDAWRRRVNGMRGAVAAHSPVFRQRQRQLRRGGNRTPQGVLWCWWRRVAR